MTEHTLSSMHLGKCGRKNCECLVDPGVSYCSEKCEHADTKTENNPQDDVGSCMCGHSDCK